MAGFTEYTNVTQPFGISTDDCPVDAFMSVGTHSLNADIAALKSVYYGQIWNGIRVLDTTTGIQHKLLFLGGSESADQWTDIEEQERLVVVTNVSITNISNLEAAANTAFVAVGYTFAPSDHGKAFLINAQTTTTQNGIYLAEYVSPTALKLIRHPEYTGSVTMFQRTLVYSTYDGHIYRFKAGNASFSNTYEIDDYINNGVITRVGTALTMSGSLTVNGLLNADGGIATDTSNFLVDGTTGAVTSVATVQGETLKATGVIQTGTAGGSYSGTITLYGKTSGTCTLGVAATAGTATFTLPTTNGSNGHVLTTNGAGVTSWTTKTSGTVTSVGITGNGGISVSGSPITSSGTITLGLGAITPTSVSTGDITTSTGNIITGTTTMAIGAAATGTISIGNAAGTLAALGNQTVAGSLSVTGNAKVAMNYSTTSGTSQVIDFRLGNVFFWNVSADTTIGIYQDNAGLAAYAGATFVVTIRNSSLTNTRTITFYDDNNLFNFASGGGTYSTTVSLAVGAMVTYTGVVLGYGGNYALYGTIANASENLTA